MKRLFFVLMITIMVALLYSSADSDMYRRDIYWTVNVYAYEGPNGEFGPYFCGSYCENISVLLTTLHGATGDHLGDIVRVRYEWRSRYDAKGLIQSQQADKLLRMLKLHPTKTPLHEDDSKKESLTRCSEILRQMNTIHK